jgi:Rad3-related DNA helicase
MNDPWVDAKQELLGDRGFMEFLLPEAIATMKQMCGRLIRNENSKGTLSIMDSRLNTKGYGQKILNSLPQVAGNIELVDKVIINCVPAKPKRRLNVE